MTIETKDERHRYLFQNPDEINTMQDFWQLDKISSGKLKLLYFSIMGSGQFGTSLTDYNY